MAENFVIDNMINLDPRFKAILDLPDEVFEQSYDKAKELFDVIFNSEEVRNASLRSAKAMPNYDKASCENALSEMVNEINKINNISNAKKQFLIDIVTKSAELTMEYAENPRERVEVKVYRLNPEAILPTYAHPTDAGADVAAVEETKIEVGETKLVKTGLAVAIPAGYEIQIRPRSGFSLKTGLRIANTPGTIDSSYRGEICIIMTNTGETAYVIDKGMKIAQMIIAPTPMIQWNEVPSDADLGTTDRAAGGFGSTDTAS